MSARAVPRMLPLVFLAVLLAASGLGLLCTRISDFDDSVLLVGSRLVHTGLLPYRDFYTHYGPLGFSLQSALSNVVRPPPVALRVGETLCLCLLAGLALALGRRVGRGPSTFWVVLLFTLVLSTMAPLPSFYGFAFALAALACSVLGDDARSRPAANAWAASCGLLLAAAALTRPAFAVYAGAAWFVLAVLVSPARERLRPMAVVLLAFAVGLAAIWGLLYRSLALRDVIEATILIPARFHGSGMRFREASFIRAPLPGALLITGILAAVPLVWAGALPSRRGRALAAAGVLVGGALPLWLRWSERPARDATLIAMGGFAIVTVIILVERSALRQSLTLRAAALFGLATAALEHYLWARADRPHVIPFLVAGAAGAALALKNFRLLGKCMVAALFLVFYPVFVHDPDRALAPAETLWKGGLAALRSHLRAPGASWRSVWPCGEAPADAVRAVVEADRKADPASRFVAVASSQAFTEQNPVLLFVLSSRLPYTRWYQYDPGVQDSPAVQDAMIQELERSGSRTAVVWRAEVFANGRDPSTPLPRSAFDEAFDRMFPVRGPQYGLYEIRFRADPSP